MDPPCPRAGISTVSSNWRSAYAFTAGAVVPPRTRLDSLLDSFASSFSRAAAALSGFASNPHHLLVGLIPVHPAPRHALQPFDVRRSESHHLSDGLARGCSPRARTARPSPAHNTHGKYTFEFELHGRRVRRPSSPSRSRGRPAKGDVRRILIGIHHASGLLLETTHALTAFADDHAHGDRAHSSRAATISTIASARWTQGIRPENEADVSRSSSIWRAAWRHRRRSSWSASATALARPLIMTGRWAMCLSDAGCVCSTITRVAGSILEFLDGTPARADGRREHLRGDLRCSVISASVVSRRGRDRRDGDRRRWSRRSDRGADAAASS